MMGFAALDPSVLLQLRHLCIPGRRYRDGAAAEFALDWRRILRMQNNQA
jgi:hypothetical protein